LSSRLRAHGSLDDPQLGTTWGPADAEMRRQGIARLGDRPLIRMQTPLRGGQRAVPRDLPQDVHRDTRVSHPGQPGMPQIVPAQVLIAEPSHHVIPMRGVTKDRCADPAAAGAGEQRSAGRLGDGREPGHLPAARDALVFVFWSRGSWIGDHPPWAVSGNRQGGSVGSGLPVDHRGWD
jgi:hypothetical protein